MKRYLTMMLALSLTGHFADALTMHVDAGSTCALPASALEVRAYFPDQLSRVYPVNSNFSVTFGSGVIPSGTNVVLDNTAYCLASEQDADSGCYLSSRAIPVTEGGVLGFSSCQ